MFLMRHNKKATFSFSGGSVIISTYTNITHNTFSAVTLEVRRCHSAVFLHFIQTSVCTCDVVETCLTLWLSKHWRVRGIPAREGTG